MGSDTHPRWLDGGGSAAVAAGEAPRALGSDTGGCIRQPAAVCSVVGVKPTYGGVSRYGLVAFSSSLDRQARSPALCWTRHCCAEAIAGHDPLDSTSIDTPVPSLAAEVGRDVAGMRVGVVRELWGEGTSRSSRNAFGKPWLCSVTSTPRSSK